MSNPNSNKGKYVLAALAGAAVGGSVVALSTRAVPKMISEMEGKCKQMMAGMKAAGCGAEDNGKPVAAGTEPAPQQESCHAQGGSCHGSD